ncbi:MAG: macro domain-containing protein [Acidobacteria bacterium]|nr:macro domain-containing protein [Acidobacteriota bacterium]
MEYTYTINRCELILKRGDITQEPVTAIVNSANPALSHGGGVCGAIHQAAGPELAVECAVLGGCETGMAKMTGGYQLPAGHVIHTVGPVYHAHEPEEAAQLLSSCYRESLNLALKNGIETIAFPSISTGIYGYPITAAAKIALATIVNFLKIHGKPIKVIMELFSDTDLEIYNSVYEFLQNELH